MRRARRIYQVLGAFELGIALSRRGDNKLLNQMLRDDRLLADEEQTRQVAVRLSSIRDARSREPVYEAVGGFFESDPPVLATPLEEVSPKSAMSLLSSQPVRVAVRALLKSVDEEEASAIASLLVAALLDRNEPAMPAQLRLAWLLADARVDSLYPELKRLADQSNPSASPKGSNSLALVALTLGPGEDHLFWLGWLDPAAGEHAPQRGWAIEALTHLLGSSFAPVESNLVSSVIRVGRLTDADFDGALAEAAQAQLNSGTWADDASLGRQLDVHAELRALCEIGPLTRQSITSYLHSDIARALSSAPPSTTELRFLATAVADDALELEQLHDIATRLEAIALGDEGTATELLYARFVVRRVAAKLDGAVSDPPFSVDADQVALAGGASSERADDVLAAWFDSEPTATEVEHVLSAIERQPDAAESESARNWFVSRSELDRRQVVTALALVATRPSRSRLSTFVAASRGYDEELVVRDVVAAVMRASRGEERRDLIESLIALEPGSSGAQRQVGELIEWLLAAGTKVDFDNAVSAVQAVGTGHRMGQSLASAFRTSNDVHKWKIPSGLRELFEEAKIRLPKGEFESRKKRSIRRPFR